MASLRSCTHDGTTAVVADQVPTYNSPKVEKVESVSSKYNAPAQFQVRSGYDLTLDVKRCFSLPMKMVLIMVLLIMHHSNSPRTLVLLISAPQFFQFRRITQG